MGSSQCFSVTAEKRSGVVLGAEKTEFPWQNHPFVPYYRAGIPIGKQDCARAEEPARFPHPERSFAPWAGWRGLEMGRLRMELGGLSSAGHRSMDFMFVGIEVAP